MSTPAPSGGPSPLRVGGLALLGAGVVAGLIGLGTLATSNGGDQAAPVPTAGVTTSVDPSAGAIPSATAPAATTGPAVSAAPTGGVAVPSFPATPTNAIAAPATPSAPAGLAGGDGSGARPAVVRAPLRVYNNSTITGLANRAAQDFRDAGWPVEQVANYPSGIIPTSTVYFRPASGEQPSATALGSEFGLRVEPRFDGLDDASPGLIVIVTNNYQRR